MSHGVDCWGNNPGTLSCDQFSAIHWKTMAAPYSNGLQSHDLKIGHPSSSPDISHQGNMPYYSPRWEPVVFQCMEAWTKWLTNTGKCLIQILLKFVLTGEFYKQLALVQATTGAEQVKSLSEPLLNNFILWCPMAMPWHKGLTHSTLDWYDTYIFELL